MSKRSIAAVVAAASLMSAVLTTPSAADAAMQYTGVNLAGGEFASQNKPGRYGYDYAYPTAAEVNYYVGKGTNVFRMPFLWERVQRGLDQPLYADDLTKIKTFVNTATNAGAYVVLDPHNYGKYNGVYIGSAGGPTDAQFANLWSQLATEFKGNSKVIFGLMNEPTQVSTTWVGSANAAIAAIRAAGATNQIFVPGVRWTGAHSWYTGTTANPSNASTMVNIVDPGDNYAIEVHQYVDSDSSGTHHTEIANNDTMIGAKRLQSFTTWARTNNVQAFLGEFAVANSIIGTGSTQIGDETIANMLDYMETNNDVWAGFSWWAGGPRWNNYPFDIEPLNIGTASEQDRESMMLLEPYMASVPEPTMLSVIGLGALALMRRRA